MSAAKNLAERYGVSERTIYRWINAIGQSIYDPAQLAIYLVQQKTPSPVAIRRVKKELKSELKP